MTESATSANDASSARQRLLHLLRQHGIAYELVEHEAVFTIEEALRATPELEGIKTKNVFLRDGKGERHFLVIVPHDRRLDLAALAGVVNARKLSMGSPDRLLRHLGVTPGAVGVFSVVNDAEGRVELFIDTAVWQANAVQGHPLENTATISVSHHGLEAFLAATGHQPRVVEIP